MPRFWFMERWEPSFCETKMLRADCRQRATGQAFPQWRRGSEEVGARQAETDEAAQAGTRTTLDAATCLAARARGGGFLSLPVADARSFEVAAVGVGWSRGV